MLINYPAVLVCAVLSMVVGAIWYGPIFGKKWKEITGVDVHDTEMRKRMNHSTGPLYITQFLLTLFQVYVLAYLIAAWPGANGVKLALFLWAGFVVPTVVGVTMWGHGSARTAWASFLIQALYQLLMFTIYGYILWVWI